MWKRIRESVRHWCRKKAPPNLGELGEQEAVRFLQKKRYQVVDRNVAFREGEIDIVAVHDRTVVFVEVKTRRSDRKGAPWEAVDAGKQEKLIRAASVYLSRERLTDQRYRFDIISITWEDESSRPEIEHLESAFQAADKG